MTLDNATVLRAMEKEIEAGVSMQLAQAQRMSLDQFLLLWTNYHVQVQRRGGRGQELPFAEDYLKDFEDGVLFTHLLHSIAPEAVAETPGLLTTLDPSTRIKELVSCTSKLDPPVDAAFVVNNQVYTAATSQERKELNAAFLAHLFMTHPGLRMRHDSGVQEVAVIQAASEHTMHEWTERVRPFLSVLARGDASVEEVEVTLDHSAQRILDAMPSGEIRKRAALKAVELEKAKRALARSKEPQPSEFPTYAQHADAVARQLCAVHSTSAMLGDRIHRGAEIYRTLQARCVHFTYSMLNSRLLHKSVELLDCRAEAEVRVR